MGGPPYFSPYGAQSFTRAVSASARTVVPRFWRMYLALWLISRWRLPATPCLTLPVAVSLKRFLTPLLVFNLGIFVSFTVDTSNQPWQPLWPDRQMNHVSVKRAPLGQRGAEGKAGSRASLANSRIGDVQSGSTAPGERGRRGEKRGAA